MKFIFGLFALCFCSLMMFGCSEHVPNKHEQLYLDTVDSLKLYHDLPAIKSQIEGSDVVRDYLSLTFDEYLEKHDINEYELDLLSNSLQVTISITKAFKGIEDNMNEIQSIEPLERIDTNSTQEDYSFNKVKPIDLEDYDEDTSSTPQIMMAK